MSDTLFKVSSITYAFKARDLLRTAGMKAYIDRETGFTSDNGCGYVVIVPKDGDRAHLLLKSKGIKILDKTQRGESPP